MAMGYTKVNNLPQPSTTIHNHSQLPTPPKKPPITTQKTTHNHPQQPRTIRNHSQPPVTTNNFPQPPTTIHNHPQPPKKLPITTQKPTHNHPQPSTTPTTIHNHPKVTQIKPKLVTSSYMLLHFRC